MRVNGSDDGANQNIKTPLEVTLMLQNNQKIIRHKVGLLNLAEELGNVSKACQMMGLSRDVQKVPFKPQVNCGFPGEMRTAQMEARPLLRLSDNSSSRCYWRDELMSA